MKRNSIKLDTKFDPIEKDLIRINTKLAVMESRLQISAQM